MNLKKLEAFLLLLIEGAVKLGTGEVDAGGIQTLSDEWPTITGIPVILEAEPKKLIEKILAAWKQLAVKIEKAGFLPIKAMRVVMSFMVSRFDFVASGFAFQHSWLEGLQGVLDSVFCGILGLSGRTAKLFLRLPVEYGGAGCP